MKTTKWIIGFMLTFFSLSLQAQSDEARQQGANQEVNDSQTPEQPDNETGNQDPMPRTADTPGSSQAAAAANSEDADTTAQANNTADIPQMTSSSSGSPAVLAGENGEERDGTNTVQRASMNMAGSPAGNLNLSEGQAVDADTELADRQDRTQETQVSAKVRSQGSNTDGASNEVNNDSRKENNERSDQSLSAKDKSNQSSAQEEDKKAEKRKRKKDRG